MKTKTNTRKTQEVAAISTTMSDFKNAALIVSVLINLFVLTTVLVIQASPTFALGLVTLG